MRETTHAGAWAPLRRPVFRTIWLAAFVANVGTWMQTVAGQWLLVEHHSSSLLISLVQSASSVPVLLLVIPAGVVADFLDRRRLLLAVQGVQTVLAGLLALLTAAGQTTPQVLLLFTFLLGCGAAAQLPAYQAMVSDLLPRAELRQGAALSSLGVNLARAVGPAIAGLLLAHLGIAWLFALNAISFALFGLALLAAPATRHTAGSAVRPASWSSLEAGGRYVRHAPAVRRILLRLVLFAVPANVLWALLAPLAERRLGLGATGYGVLLGAAGAGAVAGAILLPMLTGRLSASRQLTIASLGYGLGLIALAFTRNAAVAVAVLIPVGVAWIAVIAGLNATTQAFLPDWVRARALAIYQMVLFGVFAGSAAAWGAVASWLGIDRAFAVAGLLLLATAVAGMWLPLRRTDLGDRTAVPVGVLPEATFIGRPEDPMEIIVRYDVPADRRDAFLDAMTDLRTSRLRTGATHWALLRDAADPSRMIEQYRVPSRADYLDQNEHRQTPYDHEVRHRVEALADAVSTEPLVAVQQ
ncbi:MFS transporter [Actinoplanes sp. DH11]|uniref:MFS transporter n=1 Tax=Actinoplanes sp. DH11 TaxID=2857011 RepID=UPI001E4B8B94|nr:MFS transporter [Actinoplanes sp. DH11]